MDAAGEQGPKWTEVLVQRQLSSVCGAVEWTGHVWDMANVDMLAPLLLECLMQLASHPVASF